MAWVYPNLKKRGQVGVVGNHVPIDRPAILRPVACNRTGDGRDTG